jgi:hypothetical protein
MWASASFGWIARGAVVACARVDLDTTSRVLEALISAGQRVASTARRVLGRRLPQ